MTRPVTRLVHEVMKDQRRKNVKKGNSSIPPEGTSAIVGSYRLWSESVS